MYIEIINAYIYCESVKEKLDMKCLQLRKSVKYYHIKNYKSKIRLYYFKCR